MANLSAFQNTTRLLLTETIWLEPEQVEQARTISHRNTHGLVSETQGWQYYLSTLALMGFKQWIGERLPESVIEQPPNASAPLTESVSYLQVDDFTFCLITVEHVLDETVQIPHVAVEEPAHAAHFYILNEVSEEEGCVTIRGFLRFDEWIQFRDRHRLQPQQGYYAIPLAALDAEPNHLLMYCQLLEPSAIALPVSRTSMTAQLSASLSQTTTVLTQWLQNTFDESWQAIDQLINPDAYLVFSTRHVAAGAKRGKLLNLGVNLSQQMVALLVNVVPETDGKLNILVQLHPTGTMQYLMPDVRLNLRSSTGQTLQEVVSRSQDNYIQLKPFKGKPGIQFCVAIQYDDATVEENFTL